MLKKSLFQNVKSIHYLILCYTWFVFHRIARHTKGFLAEEQEKHSLFPELVNQQLTAAAAFTITLEFVILLNC